MHIQHHLSMGDLFLFPIICKFSLLLWLEYNPYQSTDCAQQQHDQQHQNHNPGESSLFFNTGLCFHFITQYAAVGYGLVLGIDTIVPDMRVYIQPLSAFANLPMLCIVGEPLPCRIVVMLLILRNQIAAHRTGLGFVHSGLRTWNMILQLRCHTTYGAVSPVAEFVKLPDSIVDVIAGINKTADLAAIAAGSVIVFFKVHFHVTPGAAAPVSIFVAFPVLPRDVDMVQFGFQHITTAQAKLLPLLRRSRSRNMVQKLFLFATGKAGIPMAAAVFGQGLTEFMPRISGSSTYITGIIAVVVIGVGGFGNTFLPYAAAAAAGVGNRACFLTGSLRDDRSGAPSVLSGVYFLTDTACPAVVFRLRALGTASMGCRDRNYFFLGRVGPLYSRRDPVSGLLDL